MQTSNALARGLAAVVLCSVIGVGCSHSSGGGSGFAASTAPGSTVGSNQPAQPAAPLPVYGTRKCWPIVLVHGFSGFKNLGPLNYWMDIPDILRAHGFEVYQVQDKAWATIEERAQECKNQILAKYPDPRVKINLIGHSMGGLDIRYMITKLGMGDRIASATTIGTPHHGSSVADVIFGIVPDPMVNAINGVFKVLGYDLKGGKQLTTVYCDQTFNPNTPDDPRVTYFSWTGAADPSGSQPGHSIIEPFFWPTYMVLSNLEGENDGLVSTKSAQWGHFQGVFAGDHLNEVGQPVGVTPSAFDYQTFYEKWAEQLEAQGFGPP